MNLHKDLWNYSAYIEAALASGQFQIAGSLLSNFSAADDLQENYKHFSTAYLHAVENTMLSYSDSLALLTLAYQCPATDGPAVYKARALYNDLYKTILEFNDDNCVPEGFAMRTSANSQEQIASSKLIEREQSIDFRNKTIYKIYPNPNAGDLFIMGKSPFEQLRLVISDVSNRVLLNRRIDLGADGRYYQKLDLVNGLYFISITSKNGRFTRKILLDKK